MPNIKLIRAIFIYYYVQYSNFRFLDQLFSSYLCLQTHRQTDRHTDTNTQTDMSTPELQLINQTIKMKQYCSSSEREHEKPQEDGNPARRFGAFTDYIIGFPTQAGKYLLL